METSRFPGRSPAPEIYTVGHSTHQPEELVEVLRRHGIGCLIDVRRAPRSRRLPHFSKESLERWLPEQGIAYEHLSELGGWRRPRHDSPNGAWRVEAFQGYADYMATPEFEAGLDRAKAMAGKRLSALMCAEAVWWRCHRRLVSDALLVRGWRVRHIGGTGDAVDHVLTPFATVDRGTITYPPPQGSLPLESPRRP
jgi:uncharacterized protein (DUF488 family)